MSADGDNFERHEFARKAYELALGALHRYKYDSPGQSGVPESFDMELLAWVGAAQAVLEAWCAAENRPSAACRKWHNWWGISAVGDQAWVAGVHGDKIRKFKSPESSALSWAYLVLHSSEYDKPREALETAIAFWRMCPKHSILAYKSFPLHFCPIYCENNPRYARDVISIMEELAPVLGIVEREAT